MEIKANKENLENALASIGKNEDPKEPLKISKEEEIGIHKGALNTLAAERNELVKMIGNVETIMQAHLGRLKELGVDIQTK